MLGQFNDTQNKEIVSNVIDTLKLNPLTDAIPRAVVPTIQPTFEVNKSFTTILRSGGVNTTAGTTVLYTTPSDKDFYLTGLMLSYIKDSNADGADSVSTGVRVTCVTEGTAKILMSIPNMTLTAQQGIVTENLAKPLKIDRNTAISLANFTFTAGKSLALGRIFGFLETAGNDKSV